MARTSGQEVIPSAKRLIRSLRDVGYDFPTAVADLIDNSIEAGATRVAIDVEFNGDDSWVRIADNGLGMNLSQLQEAMRYGSEREYDNEKDLGKFGLGLKTASMSQCQRLTVASRSSVQQKDVNAYCWDLSHVDITNKWEIIRLDKKTLKTVLNHHLADTTGTVVFWQRLDRILGYRHPYGEMAKKQLLSMCRELEQHIAMVFHRFLAGEVPGKKLQIILNGNSVEPWDPYARTESKTQILDSVPIHSEHEGMAGTVYLEPYVLPHKDDFSSLDAFNRASGPRKWNRQQGFYIYRANRLIQSGGWSGLKTIDEHLKLARVALSFSPHMDDAFKINVAKMRVQLPAQIRDKIDTATKSVTQVAQETYRKSGQKSPASRSPTTTNPSASGSSTSQQTASATSPTPVRSTEAHTENSHSNHLTKLWTLDELQLNLETSASIDEKPVISKVFERFRKNLKMGDPDNDL